jgi:hypothetical protein
VHTQFWSQILKRRDHSEDLHVDGKVILEWEGVDWMHLAQDRYLWLALVNTVMNLRIP